MARVRKPKTYVLLDEQGQLIERECTKCHEVKEAGEFHSDKNKVGGKRSDCISCHNKQSRNWRQNNPEKKKENNRNWRQKNLEKERERVRNWYQNNPEKKKETARNWRQNNPEYSRNWQRNNPEAVKVMQQNRRAMKQALPDVLKVSEWEEVLNDFNTNCPLSGSNDNLQLEHFIPLSWGHGGTYVGNVYPLEASLNISMNASNPFEWIERRSPEEQQGFARVVAYLAEQNGLTVEEFKEFVYWCENNRRTVEDIEGDKTSLELWKEEAGD